MEKMEKRKRKTGTCLLMIGTSSHPKTEIIETEIKTIEEKIREGNNSQSGRRGPRNNPNRKKHLLNPYF
jgi:hypothetical protein